MTALSINRAWNETAAFLGREARLVLPIALLLVFLPGIASALLIPPEGVAPTIAQAVIGLLLALVTLVTTLIAGIAISHLALRPGASVGEALQTGGRRFGPLFGASVLIAIPLVFVFFILIMIAAPLFLIGGQTISPAAMITTLAPVVVLVALAMLAIWAKLLLMTPVAAAERVNPIEIIRRSWTLTRGHYWKLFGTFLLVLLVSGLVVGAITNVFGSLIALTLGQPAWGNLSYTVISLLQALLQTVVTTITIVLVARIYAQLSGKDGAVGEVFR